MRGLCKLMATGIGETLRTARRKQGRSLGDAAAQTRVRETYLAALEEEEFGALGGDVYVKGFLRSYARFLGLDPAPLLATYRSEHEHSDEPVALGHSSLAMPSERRPGVLLVAGGAVVLLVVLAFIGLRAGGDEPPPTVDPPPPPAREAPEAEEPVTGEAGAEPEADLEAPAVEGVELVLTVEGETSWLRVIVDGERQIEGERASGFTETFRADQEVIVRIGDASAVGLVVNGEDQGALGQPGQVVQLTCESGQTVCEREEIT
jgi:cytoskeleton protein RodZ